MLRSAHTVLRIARVIPEGQAGVTLVLNGPLAADPGQFVMVWLPGIEERPFTVAADDPLMLSIARVGPFTDALAGLSPDDRLWVRGPYGHGFDLLGRRALLVGGGSGTASLSLLAKVMLQRGGQVTAVLGARTADLLMLPWRFTDLGCHVILATDDGSLGYAGSAVGAAMDLLQKGWPDAVYGCGPEPMLRGLVRSVRDVGAQQGVAIPCQVSLEAVMKCGLGVCGNCHHGEQLVCRDGPVFHASQLWPA